MPGLPRWALLAIPLAALFLWLAWPRSVIPLGRAQAQPFAFPVQDGRVLLVDAGCDERAGQGSALWLDPARHRTRVLPAFSLPRSGFTATRLPDGRILIAGGRGTRVERVANAGYSIGFGNAEDDATILDPLSGTMQRAGHLRAARFEHATVTLAGGRVAVIGGRNARHGLDTIEAFDPRSNAWRPLGRMTAPRRGHTAVLLGNGRVLILGGYDDVGSQRTWRSECEIFDPATGTSAVAGRLLAPRTHCAAVLLGDGRVLVIGGYGDGTDPLGDAELFDPASGRSVAAGRLSEQRAEFAAVTLKDGRVLVTGGSRMKDSFLSRGLQAFDTVDCFDPATGRFAAAPRLRAPRYQHAAVALADGRVLLAGGRGSGAWSSRPRVYDDAEIYAAPRR